MNLTNLNFIGQYWWLWLIGLVVFGGLTIISHLRRTWWIMNSITGATEDAASDFFSGIWLMFVSAFLAWCSCIALLISLTSNIVQLFK